MADRGGHKLPKPVLAQLPAAHRADQQVQDPGSDAGYQRLAGEGNQELWEGHGRVSRQKGASL